MDNNLSCNRPGRDVWACRVALPRNVCIASEAVVRCHAFNAEIARQQWTSHEEMPQINNTDNVLSA